MHWNYRIVNEPSENGGEDWFELKEVYYHEDMSLMGYAGPCTGAETLDGVKDLLNWWVHAMTLPPLHENDFKNATVRAKPNEVDEADDV